MVDSSDQRDYRRMGIECALTYRQEGADTVHSATALNLSSTGVLFVGREALREGARLVINMTPPAALVEPLNALVEVLRVEPDADGQYQIGCRIIEFRS